ncbi:MAG: energy transducer TonB [Pseudomonadota bacterium]
MKTILLLVVLFVAACAVPEPAVQASNSGYSSSAFKEGPFLPIVRVAPKYPDAALEQRLEGYVDVVFTIDERGLVRDASVIESTNTIFDAAAIALVLRYKYKPTVIDGQPVVTDGVETRVKFKLPRSSSSTR